MCSIAPLLHCSIALCSVAAARVVDDNACAGLSSLVGRSALSLAWVTFLSGLDCARWQWRHCSRWCSIFGRWAQAYSLHEIGSQPGRTRARKPIWNHLRASLSPIGQFICLFSLCSARPICPIWFVPIKVGAHSLPTHYCRLHPSNRPADHLPTIGLKVSCRLGLSSWHQSNQLTST